MYTQIQNKLLFNIKTIVKRFSAGLFEKPYSRTKALTQRLTKHWPRVKKDQTIVLELPSLCFELKVKRVKIFLLFYLMYVFVAESQLGFLRVEKEYMLLTLKGVKYRK